jgi:signal transduction histidine kinase
MRTIYGIGFGILTLTISILIFLSEVSKRNLFTPDVFTNFETALVIGFCCISVILIFLFPYLTARKLRKDGHIIMEVTDEIKNQNLDFEISSSGIREIDVVLESMDDMRLALKESLEKQWRLEQNKSEQISALAHDFKTPLTVVKGNIDLLQNIELDEISREYVKDAKVCLQQMEVYLTQLLEMIRAERGFVADMRKMELSIFVDEIASRFQGLVTQKEVSILVEKDNENVFILADKTLMERVFQNLIFNAFDFTPQNGTIKIKLTIIENYANVYFIDSGRGFDSNTLKHGMEQFYMSDASRSKKNHYGLGLYIANSIIKQHSGTMQLENDSVTGGAKINIKLPILEE